MPVSLPSPRHASPRHGGGRGGVGTPVCVRAYIRSSSSYGRNIKNYYNLVYYFLLYQLWYHLLF